MGVSGYLGIDTSNYTTSLAFADAETGEVVLNEKQLLPVENGERGLRQSDAVFHHVRNLPMLIERMKASGKAGRILGIGVSVRPRDAQDSYMPCFLVGKETADAVSLGTGCPVYPFSHQKGHIRAALYSCGAAETLLGERFAAFHVSGGTTELVLVEKGLSSVEIVGGSRDLHAGQAVDRIGVRFGLPFPCGPALEALAEGHFEKLPPTRPCVEGTWCHLSGLENRVDRLYADTSDKELCAAFAFAFLKDTLMAMTRNLRQEYPDIPVLYAGGVMSNRYLQTALGTLKNTYFAEPAFSSDNACGAALLARDADRKEGDRHGG